MTTFKTDTGGRMGGVRYEEERAGGPRAGEPTLATLIRDATREITRLFRQEVELAKVETSEKAAKVARNAAALVAGIMFTLPAMMVLLLGLGFALSALYTALGMEEGWAYWLGPTSLGLLMTIIGVGLVLKGVNTLKKTSMVPHKTIDSLRETGDWARAHREHQRADGHGANGVRREEVRA